MADDEPRILKLVSTTLSSLGYKVVATASSGDECVAMAGKYRPDFMVMDVDMPGLDGLTAAGMIAEIHDIPVIISSGHLDDEILRRFGDAKVFAYVVKPYSPAQLQAAIHVALAQHRNQRRLVAESVAEMKSNGR